MSIPEYLEKHPECDLDRDTIYRRISSGWDANIAVATPVDYYIKRYTSSDGRTYTLKEWSEITGLDDQLIYRRIEMQGWSVDQAISAPNYSGKIQYGGFAFWGSDWDRIKGFQIGTTAKYTRAGWTPEQIFNSVPQASPKMGIFFIDKKGHPIQENPNNMQN